MLKLLTGIWAVLILGHPCFAVAQKDQAGAKDLKEEVATYYWGFFVRGPNQEKLAEEEAERLQKGHIANLEKLHAEGKLLMAGPLGGAGNLRGIVVMDVRTPEEVAECFKNDPFVKIGRLEMQAHKWFTTRDAIKNPDQPIKMVEYRIGLVNKGPAWSPEPSTDSQRIQDGHMDNIRKMAAAGILALAGPLAEAGDLRGIFVFRTKDEEKIRSMVATDPAVQAERLKVELYPLYLAAGVLGP